MGSIVRYLMWAVILLCGLRATAQVQAQDTLLSYSGQNMRQGINSWTYLNTIYAGMSIGEQQYLRLSAGTDWIYNNSINGTGEYIRQINKFSFQHLFAVSSIHSVGHEGEFLEYRANNNLQGRYAGFYQLELPIDSNLALRAKPKAGWAIDFRRSNQDHGPYLGFNGEMNYFNKAKALRTNALLIADQSWVVPREQQLLGARVSLDKQFEQAASVQLGAEYRRRKQEDYFQDNIRSTVSDSLSFTAGLNYNLLKNLAFISNAVLVVPSRDFDYRLVENEGVLRRNTGFGENQLIAEAALQYRKRKIRIKAGLDLNSRTRLYYAERLPSDSQEIVYEQAVALEESRNIAETTYGYGFEGTIRLNPKHTLTANYRGQLLRVNTESELNTQDRDEALYSYELGYYWQLTRAFQLAMRNSGTYRHIIYIFGEQSAENYIERIIRFQPEFTWRTNRLFWNGSYALTSTYNVRDFESQASRNRSNRIFEINQRLTYAFHPRISLELTFLRRENRIGLLDWDNFKESPLDTTIIYETEPGIEGKLLAKHKNTNLALKVGVRYFRNELRSSLSTTAENGSGTVRVYNNAITEQIGPQMRLQFTYLRQTAIDLKISYLRFLQYNDYTLTDELFVGQSRSRDQLDARIVNNFFFFELKGQIFIGRNKNQKP